ncbi:ABC transporter permease [Kribbella sp. CA-293567]|uniref:ABC transporter permease n=1 Tax=Kribbella sp. CA-293567 TaxID=3002436 RepID=UPI0022DE3A16|nr:ABC transporter permease [Kribbella sp. CA-293567]WBQ01891.1 ABC transporter permease [Kribbella sp. CA-293567]
MIAALATEYTKLVHASVVRATTVILVLGIGLICSTMLLATNTEDPQLAAKLGALIDPGGWAGYLTTAAQVTGAGGLLGTGVVLSWIFGREFTEGTITGLFAIPVRRTTIATAKLLVYFTWSVATSTALLTALLILGLLFGLGPIPAEALPAIGRQFALTVLTAAIAIPAAWAATLGRSILAGIGTTVGILILSQLTVITGAGAWTPFAAPALWAISAGTEVSNLQLALIAPTVLAVAGLTAHTWHRLQLNR